MTDSLDRLPQGVWPQIYRDAIPGATRAAKLAAVGQQLDAFRALGLPGVAWHGFVGDLGPERFGELAAMAAERGLRSMAAFGLGSNDPARKGEWIGGVANHPLCTAVVFDMEGAWEDEADDRAKATKMFAAFRAVAPNALAIDQPWFAATLHSGFPWEETAIGCDIRAPQVYVNDFAARFGRERYAKVEEWHRSTWRTLETRLARKGLVKPRIRTVQAYRWQDIPADLVACLLANPTMLAWSDPFPAPDFVRGLRAVKTLRDNGYVGVGAVLDFQRWSNGAGMAPLVEDGRCGEKTLAALGV